MPCNIQEKLKNEQIRPYTYFFHFPPKHQHHSLNSKMHEHICLTSYRVSRGEKHVQTINKLQSRTLELFRTYSYRCNSVKNISRTWTTSKTITTNKIKTTKYEERSWIYECNFFHINKVYKEKTQQILALSLGI
jgi:hypothetical protein